MVPSRAVWVLLAATALVALEAEFLVSSLEPALAGPRPVRAVRRPDRDPDHRQRGRALAPRSCSRCGTRWTSPSRSRSAPRPRSRCSLRPALVFISLFVGHPMDFVFSTFEVAAVGALDDPGLHDLERRPEQLARGRATDRRVRHHGHLVLLRGGTCEETRTSIAWLGVLVVGRARPDARAGAGVRVRVDASLRREHRDRAFRGPADHRDDRPGVRLDAAARDLPLHPEPSAVRRRVRPRLPDRAAVGERLPPEHADRRRDHGRERQLLRSGSATRTPRSPAATPTRSSTGSRAR